jgi:chorismate synthase
MKNQDGGIIGGIVQGNCAIWKISIKGIVNLHLASSDFPEYTENSGLPGELEPLDDNI